MPQMARQHILEIPRPQIGIDHARHGTRHVARMRPVRQLRYPRGFAHGVSLVVDLGLHVDPSLHPRLGDVRAIVVRQVVAAQRDELRIVKPRVTELPEIKVMDVSIDHGATLEG